MIYLGGKISENSLNSKMELSLACLFLVAVKEERVPSRSNPLLMARFPRKGLAYCESFFLAVGFF